MARELIDTIGLIASIILPLWNIPLILNIIKRKSSGDISLWWVIGVWISIIFMVPSGLLSSDIKWKTFNIVNFILFTGVVVVTIKYRKG